VFPQAIGLAATFDRDLMHEIATAISDEARAKHHEFARRGLRGRYQGLTSGRRTSTSSAIRAGDAAGDLRRGPVAHRTHGRRVRAGAAGRRSAVPQGRCDCETLRGAQRTEADRHHFDVHPSEQDLYDTYLPAFQRLVQEGQVAAVMGAYNRVYGESASASTLLLQRTLRERWGFQGYVVSDCDSIEDIYPQSQDRQHRGRGGGARRPQRCELDCGKTYEALLPAADRV
jgi:beta-glucosidase